MSARLRWLGLAVLLVAAFLFLWELPRDRQRREREGAERQLLSFDPAEVDTLRMRRPDGGWLLVREEEGRWRLRAPVDEAAETTAAENMLRQLGREESWRTLGDLPDSLLDPYGLGGEGRGSAIVEVVERGGHRAALIVGSQIPRGGGVYVRRAGSARVELADEEMYNLAWSPHHTFRSYELFAVADTAIVRIDARLPGREWSARQDERGLWRMEDGRRLQPYQMANLMHDIATARIRQYMADDLPEPEWAAYGLHEPALDLRFETIDGREGRVRLGNEADDEMIFARRGEERTLLALLPQLLVVPELPLEDLIDRNPLVENFARLDSLSVREGPGKTVLAWRSPEGWKLRKTEDPSLDLPLRNVVVGLERFQPDGTMLLPAGRTLEQVLDRVAVRCVLFFPHGARTLRLGWQRGEEEHWLQIDGEPTLHRVGRDLYLRLHALMAAFEGAGS